MAAAAALIAGVVLIPGTGTDRRERPIADPAGRETQGGVATAPDTTVGRREAIEYFSRLPKGSPNESVRPETARIVFSAPSRFGEYTIWRARTEGPRGSATLFSSPRVGLSSSNGVEPELPPAPYVFHASGGAWPPLGVRELWGRASSSIARVRILLKDGARETVDARNGWWVFTQDFADPKPVGLQGLDAHGRVIVSNNRRIF